MKILELFCGTKSISKVFKEAGHEVVTVDINPDFNPTICQDILDLKIDGYFDVIWASPPCEAFSVATIGRNWNSDGSPKSEKAEHALKVLNKTIELIKELKPKYWFIENPRGMMRKVMTTKRNEVTYCQYGDTRMKPTDIFSNIYLHLKKCKNGMTCHERAPRGSRTGTQGLKDATERAIIPRELCEEIVNVCEGKLKIKQMQIG